MNDSVGSSQGKTVDVGTSDSDGRCAHRQGLDDVAAGTNARVEQNRDLAAGLYDAGKQIYSGDSTVGLAPAVIRTIDSVNASVDGASGVVGMTDALQDERQFSEGTQPGQVIPRKDFADELRPPDGSGAGSSSGGFASERRKQGSVK